MTNPFSSGGGGTHFEARAVAFCLATTLAEAPMRGLRAGHVARVLTQRADFGDHLDDIILRGPRTDSHDGSLHLQVKKTLTFTASDGEWKAVVVAAWRTICDAKFDAVRDRVGAVIGTYSSQADKHYQSILTWATESADGAHFIERIEKRDFSHAAKRDFILNIRNVLAEELGRPATDDDVWQLLKSFVILHFDFQNQASRDEALAVALLVGSLPNADQTEAKRIWSHLVAKAGQLVPVGGGATRETLAADLLAEDIAVEHSKSFSTDIAAVNRESNRAIADIKDTIHGLRIHRDKTYAKIKDALTTARFIQIDGEPGCGKSALLKRLAQESATLGPVFLLKDARIHPRGWSNYASIVGVTDDVVSLLREFARAGEPILFIDGIDKIADPAAQLTVNDVLRAIVSVPDLSVWRVVVTIREQNLKHLETWLDPEVMKVLSIKTVVVGNLTDDELVHVSAEFPRLAPLLKAGRGADVILRRPFFLEAILLLGENTTDATLPATEIELLGMWWQLGGGEQQSFALTQRRRNALVQLAERAASSPTSPLPIRDIDEEALAQLIEAGVLRQHALGHSVHFAHDIYEEWSLAELLIGHSDIAVFLQQNKEPDSLIRPVQLLATYRLETSVTTDDWEELYNSTGSDALRPVWQRAVLTSPLQSARATELLSRVSAFLLADDGSRLQRLLTAVRTSEVMPNPAFLDEARTPKIEAGDRAKFAMLSALPKVRTWIRFLDWLMPHIDALGPRFIPDLVRLFQVWQAQYSGHNIRHCREMGACSHRWLIEIEDARHPEKFSGRRDPFGVSELDEDDIENSVRSLFLSSVGDIKVEAADYLKRASGTRHRHRFRREIVDSSIEYAKHLPDELVDFILAAFLRHPKDRQHSNPFGIVSDYEIRELGLEDHHAFYPASPARLPFLVLLRWHTPSGLRLIRSICNFAIEVWRWAQSRGGRDEARLEPLPIMIEFDWGRQEFWGTAQAYQWFRGSWGNHACRSGLMALEQWALERLDNGEEFNAVLKDVVEGNDSVAVLGIGVSLALAAPRARAVAALPLLMSSALWQWDIPRRVGDLGMHSNEIGNWYQHRILLQAVRDLNQRPHRQEDIRGLVPYVLLSGEVELIERYTTAIRAFPDHPPISFREELANEEHMKSLRQQMQNFSEQGDPQYWKMEETPDGRIAFYSDPPTRHTKEFATQIEDHAKLNEASGLSLWAQKALDQGTLGDAFTVTDAIARAKTMDHPDLFDNLSIDDFNRYQAAAAVSGVAFVAAGYASQEELNESVLGWLLDVIHRAATGVEPSGALSFRDSHLSMHRSVFAAHAYSRLLARDIEPEMCIEGLLNLAVDVFTDVKAAVFSGAVAYGDKRPEIVWTLLCLGLKQSIYERDDAFDIHSSEWTEAEAANNIALIEEAEESIARFEFLPLPVPPVPWVKDNQKNPERRDKTKGYIRNSILLNQHDMEKTVLRLPFAPILNSSSRAAFLTFVGQLIDSMIEELQPPFADGRRSGMDSAPFEWIFSFSAWCGSLAAHLSANEVRETITNRVMACKSEAALMIMDYFLRSYMIRALLPPDAVISDERVRLWSEFADWLLNLPEWTRQRGDYLDREFQSAAFSFLFCANADFSPLVCGVDKDWPHFKKFLPILERTVREFGRHDRIYFAVITLFKHGGAALLPDPALEWLHDVIKLHKGDADFWESNGENTVEVLKHVVSEKASQLSAVNREHLTAIFDILVDGGVRGAGFLQQEMVRLA